MARAATRLAHLDEFQIHVFYHTRWKRQIVTGISVHGHTYPASREFWPSLLRSFHIAISAMDVMDHAAIFRLLREVSPKRLLRYRVEHLDGEPHIIDVCDPNFSRPRTTTTSWQHTANLAVVH